VTYISDWQVCRAVEAYQDVRQRRYPTLIEALAAAASPPAPPYETLAAETGQAVMVCYLAMRRAARRGLIEYGVSLRTGWLTPAGRDLLREKDA